MVTNQKRPRLPNLFLIGAMKSGTSSLHNWLGQHPEIFMSSVKEPGFFVDQLTWKKGWTWYKKLFESAGDCKIIGESSTEYTKLPCYENVVEKIAEFVPGSKFIYVMRDPIERTISHYWHNVRSRKKTERRDIMSALKKDSTLVNYSDYATQLEPYLDRFGRERVYILTMEELLSGPDQSLVEIFKWLEVSNPDYCVKFEKKHTTPQIVTQKIGWLSRLRFHPVWNCLGPFVPSKIRTGLRKLSEPTSIDRKKVDLTEAIEHLKHVFYPKVDRLEQLLNRKFPEWNTLNGNTLNGQARNEPSLQ